MRQANLGNPELVSLHDMNETLVIGFITGKELGAACSHFAQGCKVLNLDLQYNKQDPYIMAIPWRKVSSLS